MTAQRLLFATTFPGAVRFILVQGGSGIASSMTHQEMRALLRQRHRLGLDRQDDFTVRDITAVAEAAKTTASAVSLMIVAVASVAVLVGGAWCVAMLLHIEVVVSLSSLLFACGFSALIGVTFGLLPAQRASRLQPAMALRQG